MNFQKSIQSNLITKLLTLPIGFLSSIYIARIFGPELRGVYAFLILVLSFGIPILSFGFGAGMTYFIRLRKYNEGEVLFTVVLFSLFLGLSLGLIAFSLKVLHLLPDYILIISTKDYFIFLVVLLFSTVFFFLSRYLVSQSLFKENNIISLSDLVLLPALVFIYVHFNTQEGISIREVLEVLLISKLLTLVMQGAYIFKRFKITFAFNYSFFKDTMNYGIKSWVGDVAVRANVRIDQLILSSYLKAGELGIYAVACSIGELVWVLSDSISIVLANEIISQKTSIKVIGKTINIYKTTLVLSIVLVLLIVLATYFIIVPFGLGEEYGPINNFVGLIALSALALIPAKYATKLLSGSGKVWFTSKSTLFGSVVSIILCFVLIPFLGIPGAIISSFFGYLTVSIFCIVFVKRELNVPYKSWVSFNFLNMKQGFKEFAIKGGK